MKCGRSSSGNDTVLTVVVCTRHRPSDLDRCIQSVATAMQGLDGIEVLLIDDGDLPSADLARMKGLLESVGSELRYLKKRAEERGLYRSRLAAVRNAKGRFLLFLDDDVEIFPDYLYKLMDRWMNVDDSVAGCGGVDVLETRPSYKRLLFHLIFDPGWARDRRLSAAGRVPYLWTWKHATEPFESEFVSGCNMSFRRSALTDLEPMDWLDGYSLGEDLLLSWTARRHGNLLVDPALRVFHRRSRAARDNARKVTVATVVNHWKLLHLYGAPWWRKVALWWNTVGMAVVAVVTWEKEKLRGILEAYRLLIGKRKLGAGSRVGSP